MIGRLFWLMVAGVLGAIAASAAIGRLGRDWEARVAVRGHSMEPTLLDGDWLLVDPNAYVARPPRAGELVVARDPRDAARIVVKRAAQAEDETVLESDHPAHADDQLGPVATASLLGRPWFRYGPVERVGPIR